MLFAAVGNLLQNAFKFTQAHTEVSLNVRAGGGSHPALRLSRIDCGGLPPGVAEDLFQPFGGWGSDDKSGLGLGLTICRRTIEANKGILRVLDKPGVGCVFAIDPAPVRRRAAADFRVA